MLFLSFFNLSIVAFLKKLKYSCYIILYKLQVYNIAILIFFSFLHGSHSIWRFPGYGSNWSYSCQPTLQPQQLGIQATSETPQLTAMPDP